MTFIAAFFPDRTSSGKKNQDAALVFELKLGQLTVTPLSVCSFLTASFFFDFYIADQSSGEGMTVTSCLAAKHAQGTFL